jgi:hypothetical protein
VAARKFSKIVSALYLGFDRERVQKRFLISSVCGLRVERCLQTPGLAALDVNNAVTMALDTFCLLHSPAVPL